MKTIAQLLGLAALAPRMPRYRAPFRQSTPMGHYRPLDRQNHGAGQTKARRVMVAKSNKINRKRIKHWKF